MAANETSKKKQPLDAIDAMGKTVADNIKRLRGDMAYTKLADRLEEIERPIPTLGLRKIESYQRRVDADDLVALAIALEVSPVTLLTPYTDSDPEVRVELNGVGMPVAYLWGWLRGDNELPESGENGVPAFSAVFLSRALPPWRFTELEKEWAHGQAQFNALAAKRGTDGDNQ
ncbi:helix-turn-helix domain-containing protein [Mycobacteroides abscessus]|uniref:helix-turn-helix domain-containing protein n=1 Tax=Mycobacteroides abscessus TaxID=36809 RepID=UPI0009286F93|nr:DNA-binding protein [Mycobacteroides abscessus]SHQ69893.1 putative DNA binding protein [Mycobacteroides abscessus subsp. abscessus]SHR27967.1 putative DNA binding protein [Mycobacteroides abscessus subsp. abscessus]SHR94869.1 putative DNA binding protein [Mycobacteroides abscessus subsp. abscessus]SHS73868.1 putative DNA binding protein [Mycobacteroides abscessus subsp. abscessus]SHT60467.1 putative DNA binding protein [Mycobacteroides abscessus subsp. abscessus]